MDERGKGADAGVRSGPRGLEQHWVTAASGPEEDEGAGSRGGQADPRSFQAIVFVARSGAVDEL